MIVTLALTYALSVQKSSAIISAMLARYHNATSVVGSINQTITASFAGTTVHQNLDTQLQFERPSRLYLKQDLHPRPGHPAQSWLVVSDGIHFSYNVPNEMVKSDSKRLFEAVNQPARGEVYDVPHIYAVASQSLGDRSEPLGIVMGWSEELRRIAMSWATIEAPVPDQYRGVSCYRIAGKYREKPNMQPGGTFEMFISKDGDLLKYTVSELEGAKTNGSLAVAPVVTVWDVDIKVGAAPKPELFKVKPNS
jgi:hypothetical protein